MTTLTKTFTGFALPKSINPLHWIVRLDEAYRAYRAFKEAEEHRLHDMGLTRKQRDTAFYRQFAEKKYH